MAQVSPAHSINHKPSSAAEAAAYMQQSIRMGSRSGVIVPPPGEGTDDSINMTGSGNKRRRRPSALGVAQLSTAEQQAEASQDNHGASEDGMSMLLASYSNGFVDRTTEAHYKAETAKEDAAKSRHTMLVLVAVYVAITFIYYNTIEKIRCHECWYVPFSVAAGFLLIPLVSPLVMGKMWEHHYEIMHSFVLIVLLWTDDSLNFTLIRDFAHSDTMSDYLVRNSNLTGEEVTTGCIAANYGCLSGETWGCLSEETCSPALACVNFTQSDGSSTCSVTPETINNQTLVSYEIAAYGKFLLYQSKISIYQRLIITSVSTLILSEFMRLRFKWVLVVSGAAWFGFVASILPCIIGKEEDAREADKMCALLFPDVLNRTMQVTVIIAISCFVNKHLDKNNRFAYIRQRNAVRRIKDMQSKLDQLQKALDFTDDQKNVVHKVIDDNMRIKYKQWYVSPSQLMIIKKIGNGAFGTVWSALYLESMVVAVKQVLPEKVDFASMQKFRAEIDLMTKIRHPYVVQFLGACWDPPDVCLVLEYCGRGSLSDLLKQRFKKLSWRFPKLRIALQVAQALSYLHAIDPPVMHRDLKGDNVLLTDSLDARLADFGESKSGWDYDTTMTQAGTPFSMAPEIIRGDRSYTQKCDVHSFSMLLLQMGTEDGNLSIIADQAGGGVMWLQSIIDGWRPRVPEDVREVQGLGALIKSCWAPNEKDRPGFKEIVQKLQTCIQSLGESDINADQAIMRAAREDEDGGGGERRKTGGKNTLSGANFRAGGNFSTLQAK